VLLARRHISVLSISDRVAHPYFQDVSARSDLYLLRLVGDLLRLARLHAVNEYDGTHRRAYDNQLGWIGCMGLPVKPAAPGDAKQQDNKEYFQCSTLVRRNKQFTLFWGTMAWERHLRRNAVCRPSAPLTLFTQIERCSAGTGKMSYPHGRIFSDCADEPHAAGS